MNEWMKMGSRMKRLDLLVGCLPFELMNDPSNTHPITGWIGSARQGGVRLFFIFLDRFTACRSQNEQGKGELGLSLLSLYLYFAS